MELILTVYFLWGAALAFDYHDFSMFPYHLMLSFGFGMICWFTVKEQYFESFMGKLSRVSSYRISNHVQAQ